MKSFGENLKIERQNAGYNQREFAKKIGTTQQRVSEWETNKVEPTLSNIVAIIKTLNISFEDLINN
ncbi:MAG: helix-turn-helix transcriptional regulator [Clostridia bacterium]|nr:helix-turn-helix transcriptional regulator [Clostridia bacterium]MBQ9514088.1 helix-turn-helix transcriptional regulator [Clostridia bacterium]